MARNIFNTAQMSKVGSNTFNLDHERKFDAKIGELTPICLMEVVPGDKFQIKTSSLVRFAPMVAPIMHRVNVYTHYFFVPNRLVWDGWEDFITGNQEKVAPYIKIPLADNTIGSLYDYFGVPTGYSLNNPDVNININALPFSAYNLIYNEYYRDENLQTELVYELSDGQNSPINFNDVQKRAWQHDYFTSALPFTQKGPEATVPLGTSAPLFYDNTAGLPTILRDFNGDAVGGDGGLALFNEESLGGVAIMNDFTAIGEDNLKNSQVGVDVSKHTYADLSTASASTIIDLRRAFKLQEFLEKNARGGTRYIEHIMAHFGVRSSDARLQRPEYIGGNMNNVAISEVLQTSQTNSKIEPTDDGTPLGTMGGHGVSAGTSKGFYYKAEEHGFIIGIQSVMPVSTYQQGVPKQLLKLDRFDYFYPTFQHIGEQPIYNSELYVAYDGKNQETFGYTPRYAEYKYIQSSVHGNMKKNLDFWHMGRIFENRPQLNSDFISCDSQEFERNFAVQNAEQLYCHVYNEVKATRKMAYFGNPKL